MQMRGNPSTERRGKKLQIWCKQEIEYKETKIQCMNDVIKQ